MQRKWWWYCSHWYLWPDFLFYLTPGVWSGWTSGCLVLHSTTAPLQHLVFHLWQFQVFNSGAVGNAGGIVLIGAMKHFLFTCTGVLTGNLCISSPAIHHCDMATSGFYLWQFQVFNSGAVWLVVVLFWLDLSDMLFSPTLGFEPGTSGYLVLHSNTVPQWFLVFTSDTFRQLNSGAEEMGGGIVLIGPVTRFSVSLHQVLKWIPLDL